MRLPGSAHQPAQDQAHEPDGQPLPRPGLGLGPVPRPRGLPERAHDETAAGLPPGALPARAGLPRQPTRERGSAQANGRVERRRSRQSSHFDARVRMAHAPLASLIRPQLALLPLCSSCCRLWRPRRGAGRAAGRPPVSALCRAASFRNSETPGRRAAPSHDRWCRLLPLARGCVQQARAAAVRQVQLGRLVDGPALADWAREVICWLLCRLLSMPRISRAGPVADHGPVPRS